MNQGQTSPKAALDTTDCLEAVGVFRGWKNFLFVVLLLALLLLQLSFWTINLGHTEQPGPEQAETASGQSGLTLYGDGSQTRSFCFVTDTVAGLIALAADSDDAEEQKANPEITVLEKPDTKSENPEKNAAPEELAQQQEQPEQEQPAEETQIPAKAKEPQVPAKEQFEEKVAATEEQAAPEEAEEDALAGFGISFSRLSRIMRFVNFVLALAAIVYCLTLLSSLKISLLGRLGGINHISRAFFLSLLLVILLLPWQKLFPGVAAGAIFTPAEALSARGALLDSGGGILGRSFFYLRFTGYWIVVILLLVLAQLRSIRWTRATLRRLEII